MFKYILSALLFFSFLCAEKLDEHFDVEKLKGKKLGYYVGSFDPLHLGHQCSIEAALQKGYVDYVLVYLIGDEGHCDLSIRQTMVESVYQFDPNVLYTSWSPEKLHDVFSQCKEDIEIIGIIDSDLIVERLSTLDEAQRTHFMRGVFSEGSSAEINTLTGLPADSFLMAVRRTRELEGLENYIQERAVIGSIQCKGYSSADVRNFIQKGLPFEHMVPFFIQGLIKELGLYDFPAKINTSLREMLREMEEEDQSFRMLALERKLTKEDWKKAGSIDTKNGGKLREIIEKHGWPGVSLVGLAGASAAWLIVQHQDDNIPFQKQCLALLHDAVKAYEAPKSHYAYLLDRINKNEGRPQVYGTQWTDENGKIMLYPVEDIETLDTRRKEVGLCSLKQYKEQMKKLCHLTDDDFTL